MDKSMCTLVCRAVFQAGCFPYQVPFLGSCFRSVFHIALQRQTHDSLDEEKERQRHFQSCSDRHFDFFRCLPEHLTYVAYIRQYQDDCSHLQKI